MRVNSKSGDNTRAKQTIYVYNFLFMLSVYKKNTILVLILGLGINSIASHLNIINKSPSTSTSKCMMAPGHFLVRSTPVVHQNM